MMTMIIIKVVMKVISWHVIKHVIQLILFVMVPETILGVLAKIVLSNINLIFLFYPRIWSGTLPDIILCYLVFIRLSLWLLIFRDELFFTIFVISFTVHFLGTSIHFIRVGGFAWFLVITFAGGIDVVAGGVRLYFILLRLFHSRFLDILLRQDFI